MRLRIPGAVYRQMIEHCVAGLPNEACGFLSGIDGVVERAYLLSNEAASPTYYRPVAREMLAAMREIEGDGRELVGIFHSHVAGPAHPSATDVREAHYPDSVYVIVSLRDLDSPEVNGFLIQKKDWRDEVGSVIPVELEVVS